MNQQAVHVVGVEDFAVVVNGGKDVLGLAGDFGLEEELLAGQAFDGALDPFERAVALGAVEVGDALVVGVADEGAELLLAQGELDVAAVAAGAEAQAAELKAGLAQGHLVHRRAFGGPRLRC